MMRWINLSKLGFYHRFTFSADNLNLISSPCNTVVSCAVAGSHCQSKSKTLPTVKGKEGRYPTAAHQLHVPLPPPLHCTWLTEWRCDINMLFSSTSTLRMWQQRVIWDLKIGRFGRKGASLKKVAKLKLTSTYWSLPFTVCEHPTPRSNLTGFQNSLSCHWTQ